jgi:hypothetical protein
MNEFFTTDRTYAFLITEGPDDHRRKGWWRAELSETLKILLNLGNGPGLKREAGFLCFVFV